MRENHWYQPMTVQDMIRNRNKILIRLSNYSEPIQFNCAQFPVRPSSTETTGVTKRKMVDLAHFNRKPADHWQENQLNAALQVA